jgi:hypothetical protein
MTTQPRRPGRPAAPSPTLAVASRRGVHRTQLAELFGVPPSTVDGWRRAGCPRLSDGRFRPASVLAWLRRRDEAKVAAGAARKQRGQWTELAARALAQSRLHELAQKRADFLTRQEVVEGWAKRCFAFRAAATVLPPVLAARCANSPADVVEREAMAVVREMLLAFVRRAAPARQQSEVDQPATEPNPSAPPAGTSPTANGPHHHRTDS